MKNEPHGSDWEPRRSQRSRKPINEKPKIKGKKFVIILVILIIIIIIFAQLLYTYVIPRVTIDLKTVYHEATGGAGTGGLVNVNTKLINSGTVEVTDLIIIVSVFDSTKTLLTNETYNQQTVSPGTDYELKLVTNGNCYEAFYIEIAIRFETTNNEYNEKFTYKTYEDAMNIGFEDNIFDWGF